MHLNQIDLNLFTVFEAIHSEGSVTRAASRLNLTQPALSHSLARLRAALKDELFIRHGKKMVPTPLTRSIITDVRSALQLLELGLQESGFDPARSQRVFQIGMRNIVEPAILPPLMRKLETIAPEIAVHFLRMDRRDTETELTSGAVDMVVDVPMPVSHAVHQRELSSEDFIVVARADHKAIRGRLNLKAYLSQSHILVSSRRMGPALIDVELKSRGQRRAVLLRCQDYFTACRVVSETNLLLTMPERYARLSNAGLDNRIYPFPMKIARFSLNLYWHESADADRENCWLRDQLCDLFPPRR
ncbi:MAG TPA: LysR family transcriptional regulator [Bryobacteraceae bacterium]|jgi:DNA-binding transcriptional LysR family regulator|nr:LysR family transcriptional regulator [Bryobacteraceae bacterium]